ncbi:hypothetical protein QEZ52_17630 [Aliisedimentitalea scapharcae]|uniref:Uncharacterized protein n=1 Tax=Aliisedimentitalea scapharcae TaxID=1524259 RepID=A0ABZ2XUP1_9RHOB|nr:hypothetical protein K3727_18010 [Rhodobacteraceae bacterium M382]
MRAILVCVLLHVVLATPAQAGAWMRDRGTGFIATSSTLRQFPDYLGHETSVYAEYGLAQKLTVGLDYNQGSFSSGHAMLFARVPLGKPRTRYRFSAELGLGLYFFGGFREQMQKLTLSYGRNLETRFGHGWLAIDLASEFRQGLPGPTIKLDTTIGLSGTKRLQPMLQIETSRPAIGPVNWAVIPSIRYRTKNNISWVIGAERKSVGNHKSIGVKLAFWKEF